MLARWFRHAHAVRFTGGLGVLLLGAISVPSAIVLGQNRAGGWTIDMLFGCLGFWFAFRATGPLVRSMFGKPRPRSDAFADFARAYANAAGYAGGHRDGHHQQGRQNQQRQRQHQHQHQHQHQQQRHQANFGAMDLRSMALRVLELPADACRQTIRRRHRELVKRLHPDANRQLGPDAMARLAEQFQRVQRAYEVLSA